MALWRGSIRSSSAWSWRRSARSACSPARAPARPGRSPGGSLTRSSPASCRPSQVLTVTFTARAAGELRARLRQLGADGVQARTFHAAALRQLGYFWPQVMGGAAAAAGEQQGAAGGAGRAQSPASRCRVRPCVMSRRRSSGQRRRWRGRASTPAAAARAARDLPLEAAATASVYTAYEEAKRQAGMIDFEDLLLLMAGLIEEHRFVADELRARYRHFVVDEFQDVNPLQHRLLMAWLGDRDSLCVVGDPEQTIYSFTGASSSYLKTFRQRHEEAEVIRLVRNYRSTPQVVGLANVVIKQAKTAAALQAQAAAGPEPSWLVAEDEAGEAQQVAARIAELIRAGTPASEIAVLVRVNAQTEGYEEALTRAGVPYILRGGERFFERPEVREAMVLLRGASRAADDGTGRGSGGRGRRRAGSSGLAG